MEVTKTAVTYLLLGVQKKSLKWKFMSLLVLHGAFNISKDSRENLNMMMVKVNTKYQQFEFELFIEILLLYVYILNLTL